MANNTYKSEVGAPRAKNVPRGVNEPMSKSAAKGPKKEKVKFLWPKINLSFLNFFLDRRFQLFWGFFFLLGSLYLCIAFVSYLFTGHADQSVVEALPTTDLKEAGIESENWLGLVGAWLSNYFIYEGFGIAAFFSVPIFFFLGYKIVFRSRNISLSYITTLCLFSLCWFSLMFGYMVLRTNTVEAFSFLSGAVGYETSLWLDSLIGWGTIPLLGFFLITFIIFFFNITSFSTGKKVAAEVVTATANTFAEQPATYEQMSKGVNQYANPAASLDEDELDTQEEEFEEEDELGSEDEMPEADSEELFEETVELELKPAPVAAQVPRAVVTPPIVTPPVNTLALDIEPAAIEPDIFAEETEIEEDLFEDEKEVVDLKINKIPEEEIGSLSENYDPTLDLARYHYPTLELLNDYAAARVQVSKEELEANKDRIVETLGNYSIGIASIKATIGPTVTLYEIVPDAGVRISKIKNLEDDIALSLAALGIRIIAPIPGKGTIGIEVPNKKKEMVSIKSILSTEKFLKSEMDLPIAFGKTITNEVFITDLAKMPHLLMAGATGQGKSVGLNAILTSLIYKKHPSQLKFVLVDPKKVELSLFNKIERHFLAKLPDSDEPIITDTKKVINTLNSLCMEMDMRYDLLKDAGCRNLKEYNLKFVERRLSPKKGHRFMPFIVLVIDELADLMMTAGKEVETPIARLAQLARAIGIHLVVATQRPSVNVITGIIKANFPCRISFKVTSKIDSRTILDTGGADQLIGQGDMLFSVGSDLIRLQCAFVDTPEVDRICDFIGNQQGYDDAYLLPEFVGDESGNEKTDFDPSTRDSMFEEAARIIVTHQQGSTSLLQRRLKLGYNRAGRLIDQLESAGIVGPFEGSKAREVLIPDEYSLEQLLNNINK
ncbi:FtsK/SpoIIIE family DNA translocase [Adhaeribacter aquaticus]|uniref:FtsK/SpoIIIE family DNA translocase n=1 Tax=Adhaeribacter aquaticus TaxID=299567 RepID=UPI0004010B0E|nr:DNA translocase FtsK [Adhaeribacter aquaticus]